MAHGEWLRRLARALVGDAAADDVVQETYEVALREPRHDGPLRPWLAGVARNLARMRLRSGSRRAQREQREDSAGPVDAPTPEELVARARMQQLVARLVLELDEPFRATLMLRYHEGLSAADIARAQGVPAGTVRWRLKQGLERVRTQLDAEHAGDRKRWVVLLGPAAPTVQIATTATAKGLWLGGLAVKTGTKIAVVIAMLLALVAGTRVAGLWGKKTDKPAAAAAVKDGAPAAPGKSAAAPGGGGAAKAAGPAMPVLRDDDPRGALRLEGIVLDEAGAGAPRARVAIDTYPARVVETESDGSFVFDGLIARDYRVEATSGDQYAGPARLRLTDKHEPVTLRLRAGGVVEVAVTDRAGGAPVEGATVELRGSLVWSGTTGGDGTATLRGVGPTWAPLAVVAKGYAPAAIMVSTSGDPKIPSRYAVALGRGAAVAGRVIDEAGKPIAGARVTAASASEPFPVIDPRRDGVLTGADGAFTIPALAAGSYRLTASDAAHAAATSTPIVLDGKSPRGGFELVMSGGGAIRGIVTDTAGQPIAAADVRVVSRGHVDWRPRRQAFTGDDGRFEITGLARRAVEIVVWHPSGSSAIVPADLATKREHELTIALEITGAISGRVVDRSGEPVGDAQVLAEPEATGNMDVRNVWTVRGEQLAVTDADGGFTFAGLPPGAYRVRAAQPAAPEHALWQGNGAVARPGDPPITLTLSADGGVTGKVAFADGKVPEVISVELNGGWAVPFASKDGSFTIDAPDGTVIVRISGPGFVPRRLETKVADGKRTDLGTITVEPGRSVSGRVLDDRGHPVEGATVAAGALLSGGGAELYLENESIGARSTTTDENGRYEMSGFGPRNLTVVAGKDGAGRSRSVPVAASKDSAVVDLVLEPVGSVDGKITRGGQALGDTVVIANPIGAVSSNFFVVTGPDGTFALDALTPGYYFIYPMLGGGGNRPKDMALRTVEVSAGERVKIEIDASPGKGTLTIDVKTDAGKVVGVAQIITVQAKVDAPNMGALRDGTFLPPSLRDGATLMMHIRQAIKGPAIIEGMRPGEYTSCVVPMPVGEDLMAARALAESADDLPMKCVPSKIADGPVTIDVVVPAAWAEKPSAAPTP